MAGIKVFVSSTCYDLSRLRGKLRTFIDDLGYDPVMSEYGDVTYDPRYHTHTSCTREVDNCDMLVLIIGSRFGGEPVPESLESIDLEKLKKESNGGAYLETKHISITQLEVLRAIQKSIPIYTFVEKRVWDDHSHYARNRDLVEQMNYKSIDKPETARYIFGFIDYLRLKNNNNCLFPFDDEEGIKSALKKQWSGYFQRLLQEQRLFQERCENEYHDKKATESKEISKTLMFQLKSRYDVHNGFSINQKFHISDGLYKKISHIRIMNFTSNLMMNPEIGEASCIHEGGMALSDAIEQVMEETNALVEWILTEPNRYNLEDLKTKIANKRAGSSDGALYCALAKMYNNLSTETIYSRRHEMLPILFRYYVMKTSMPFGIFNVEFIGDADCENYSYVQVDLYSAALSNENERRCFVIWQKDDPENYQFFVNNFNNIKNNPLLCKEPTLETMKKWADKWKEIQLA